MAALLDGGGGGGGGGRVWMQTGLLHGAISWTARRCMVIVFTTTVT